MATGTIPLKQHYTHDELKAIWIAGGGNPDLADLMAYVAEAESGGRANVRNSIGATGLWQIYNGPNTDPALKDPILNAKAAVKKLETQGLDAWVSSKNTWARKVNPDDVAKTAGKGGPLGGLAALGNVGDAVDAVGKAVTSPIDAVKGAVEPLRDIGQFFVGLAELILTPEGWRRILKVILGGTILLFGLSQLTKAMNGPRPIRAAARAGTRATAAVATRGGSEVAKAAA